MRQAEAALQQARARLGLDRRRRQTTRSTSRRPRSCARRAPRSTRRVGSAIASRPSCSAASPRAPISKRADAQLQIAEGRYQDALEEVRNRQAVLAQRRSELALARQQLEDTVLRSPIDGVVRERHAFAGEYRAAGTPVVTVVRQNPLRLQLAVPERAAAGVRVGQAGARHGRGRSRQSTRAASRGSSPAITEGNRTLPIEAEVPNQHGRAAPRHVRHAPRSSPSEAHGLVVPQSALVVFAGVEKRAAREGRQGARAARAHRAAASAIRSKILEGVAAGDLVITAPGGLADGAAVRVAAVGAESCALSPPSASSVRSSPRCSSSRSSSSAPPRSSASASIAFPPSICRNVMVRTTLPGASVEEVETQVSDVARGGRQPRRGHQRAAVGLGAGPVDGERHVQPRSRHRHRGAGRARPRRRRCCGTLPDDVDPPVIFKQDSDDSPVLSIALSGNLSIRELTEIADKIVKVPLERSAGVGEVQIVGGLERAINIWVEADRLAAYQLPITEVRDGAAAAERRPAGRQRHRPAPQRAHAAHDRAASPTRSSSTTW